MISEEQFIKNVKNVSGHRKHAVNNSYGVYDAYKYYRKNKPSDPKYILTESQYFSIIRNVNKYFADNLLNGEEIKFPNKMGSLELRKKEGKIYFKDGKLKTNLPVDWDKTIKLWYEDSESFKNKVLIRVEEKELFKIHYNKTTANYNNKSFYTFNVNRDLKRKIKNKIKNNSIDTLYTYGRTIH